MVGCTDEMVRLVLNGDRNPNTKTGTLILNAAEKVAKFNHENVPAA